MSKKITIIGNNNSGQVISDGGRIKIRLYAKLLKDEGFDVEIVDLFNWKRRCLVILKQIKKAIKSHHDIVIMAGPNGSRMIIPYVWKLNKKYNTRVVFCPVGIGTIDKLVRNMTSDDFSSFISSKKFYGKRDKKFEKYLGSFDCVVLENKVLEDCYQNFYHLKNTKVLTNFRTTDYQNKVEIAKSNRDLHCVFLSRVCENKGIIDLVESINEINSLSETKKVYLDIFGDLQLSNTNIIFKNTNEFVKYCGTIKHEDSYTTLSSYELFVLPTKYYGEGTPGALVESLIVGTPVLLSDYCQSKELIIDGYNGYLFTMNSKESLKEKLFFILKYKNKLLKMRNNAKESSKRFVYKYVREDFMKYIGGVDA